MKSGKGGAATRRPFRMRGPRRHRLETGVGDKGGLEGAMANRVIFGCLSFVAGGAVGLGLGFGGGLAWITWAETSCFEGYCGYVAAFHALIGAGVGAVAGPWLASRWLR